MSFHPLHPRNAAAILLGMMLVMGSPALAKGRYYNHSGSIDTSHPDWMSVLPGSTSIAALSIPGTHDTMAFTSTGGDLTQTQSLSLRSQLDAGIRALDIRCRHISNSFTIHHGVVYLNTNFDDVLTTAIQFLREHPGETLLMRVKKEHTEENVTRSFHQTFEAYRDQPAYSPYIWRGTHVPTLGEVRGRIVILDDFGGGAYGVSWGSLQLQDDWTVDTLFDIDDKWNKVRTHLDQTTAGAPSTLYVNFLSGSSVLAFPYMVAGGDGLSNRGVNDYAIDHLVGGHAQRAGVMMMDFPGAGLIDAILALNYRLLPASQALPGDFATIFRNIAYTLDGDAQGRWYGLKAFVHNAAPGRIWHMMVLKSSWGGWMNHEGSFFQSSAIDDYTHIAFPTRTVTSAVSNGFLAGFVNGQLSSLTGSPADRAGELHRRVRTRFPFQSWTVLVKKAPGGLSNWAYADYGTGYKTSLGDYTYAVQGYSAVDGVYLYEHTNYEGNMLHLTSSIGRLGDVGFNDILSSIRFIGPHVATFCEHLDQTGRCFSTSQSVSDINSIPAGPWNDLITSVRF
ncbi:phosphatidylinositol-specific phospholipase C domain-containing protein [Hyalangium rubrum]|uniref:1-phosphatidylinositol phosphodiesterase n=1 Tax=Hyalangium rubrum TaxID=3103134 RepID=A0ABU5HK89_9BACT|nr:phosphatidylinositol-specific phospholipase C domain-containing protein [Hyalangium sp. s54d21]MDY7233339.1 phosphatidylinositol-specific phospholipase C domain-containing protein [Hyalangium sp. s54d21]